MSLQSIISVDKKFQTSVNLEYDINNVDKITGYIPTEQSVAVMDKFLRGIYYPSSAKRANVLVGPYGRGKSHLLLVLSAILSLDVVSEDKKKVNKVLKDLTKKISRINEQTGVLIESLLNSNTRLLPVLVNSNGVDISQNLILALRDALERAGILDLLPTTHFDAAIEVLTMWKKDYPKAFSTFVSELKSRKIEPTLFALNLEKYDLEAYNTFCEIYPKIAAGTKFNPYSNTDVIKLYQAVNHALKESTAFSGMFIIFDEFSKFVEANLDKSRMANFKVIQDLAEASDRESNPQMHFTCVTHKALLDYSASDSFKTVEGRFGNINFVASSEQSYELIANAIIKKPEFLQFKEANKENFNNLINLSSIGIFSDIEKLAYGFFPIAPVTAYALLRVSEKVGQNERTVFTFLAQDEKGTFVEFIKNNDGFSLMTVDAVFDYFQDLFKKSLFNETVHSMWAKANSALYQVEDANAHKVIKALSIIGIVGDEKFRPVSTHIKAALNFKDKEFDKAIKLLKEKSIVAQRESSEFVLLTANGVDVQNSVNNFVNSKAVKMNRCEYLNKLLETKYLMPRQYNDEYSMIRYFQVEFMEAEDLIRTKNWLQLFEGVNADGLILNILFSNKLCSAEVIEKIKEFAGQQQIIACVPETEELFDDIIIKQLSAVAELKHSDVAKGDKHYLEELEVYEEDAEKRLSKYIDELYSATSPKSHFYNCDGEIPDIRKQINLNKVISRICSQKYGKAPKINNEMINKNNLSSPIRKARELVVNHILESSEQTTLPCMEGFGSEVSVFNSVFVATGLNQTLMVADEGLKAVLSEIETFVKNAETKKQKFSNLFDTLSSAPYGVRKGIIPMLIAYVLRPYKESVVLYYGKNEVELSADIICSIIDVNGIDYQILLESGTQKKDESIAELLDVFAQYADTQSKSINKIYNVVKLMQNWMRSLPEYTKRCESICENGLFIQLSLEELNFKKELLKFEINAREFLFEYVFKNNSKAELKHAIEKVKLLKSRLDNHISNVKDYLILETKKIFGDRSTGTLASAILDWKQKLDDKTKKRMFDTKTNQILGYLLSINNYDDVKLIEELSKCVTGINLADWNNSMIDKYKEMLSSAILAINEFNVSSDDEEGANGIEVVINGEKISKTFASVKTTPMGMTVKNNIESVFEEYGDSISSDEKLSILLNVIKTLIN